MTVLEWLDASNMYSSFEKKHYIKIAMDRGVDPNADVYDETQVTKRQKDLMDADIIWTAVLKRPSNTASISQSHNGYQKTIGSEQDFYQDDKIQYAIRIYQRYGDEKGDDLIQLSEKKKIRTISIEDVDSLC
jgi:uncharacterized protein YmfQ (DUF2313 family)